MLLGGGARQDAVQVGHHRRVVLAERLLRRCEGRSRADAEGGDGDVLGRARVGTSPPGNQCTMRGCFEGAESTAAPGRQQNICAERAAETTHRRRFCVPALPPRCEGGRRARARLRVVGDGRHRRQRGLLHVALRALQQQQQLRHQRVHVRRHDLRVRRLREVHHRRRRVRLRTRESPRTVAYRQNARPPALGSCAPLRSCSLRDTYVGSD